MTRTSVPSVPTREQLMKLVTAEITTGGHLDIRKAHDLWKEIYENMKIEANLDPSGWQAKSLPILRSIVEKMEKIVART